MDITIITINYNGEKTLKRTLESIYQQSYNKKFEYIIIDGKSTDKSLEVIKGYQKKFLERNIIYKWISEPDSGIYNAMNKGIILSSGEIIGFLNSDDWYERDTLKKVADNFEKNNIDMLYGMLRYVDNEKFVRIKGEYNACGINHYPTVFLKKIIYKRYGNYNEKYKIAADADLLLRLKQEKINYKFIESILTNFSITGISNKNFFKGNLEYIEICHKYGEYSLTRVVLEYIKLVTRYIYIKFLK